MATWRLLSNKGSTMDTRRHITTTEGKEVGESISVEKPMLRVKVVVIEMSLVRSI